MENVRVVSHINHVFHATVVHGDVEELARSVERKEMLWDFVVKEMSVLLKHEFNGLTGCSACNSLCGSAITFNEEKDVGITVRNHKHAVWSEIVTKLCFEIEKEMDLFSIRVHLVGVFKNGVFCEIRNPENPCFKFYRTTNTITHDLMKV